MSNDQPAHGPSELLMRAFGVDRAAVERAEAGWRADASEAAMLRDYLAQAYADPAESDVERSTEAEHLRAENRELKHVLNWASAQLARANRERDLLERRLTDLQDRVDAAAVGAIGEDTVIAVDAEHTVEATASELRDRLHAVIDMLTAENGELRDETQALSLSRDQARLERAYAQEEISWLKQQVADLRSQKADLSDRVVSLTEELSNAGHDTTRQADHAGGTSAGTSAARAIDAAIPHPATAVDGATAVADTEIVSAGSPDLGYDTGL